MSQREIEIILARQLAEYLALPMFIVNPVGDLLFYNEPAEQVLGLRYDETGPMPASEWATVFHPVDEDGSSLAPEDLPLIIAMTEHRPAFRRIWIRGLDGIQREIEISAFPLLAQGHRFLGAIAVFGELAL